MASRLISFYCEQVVSCYVRKHYVGSKTVPMAVIGMMQSFLNLWRHFKLTAAQLKALQAFFVEQKEASTPDSFHVRYRNPSSFSIPLQSINIESEKLKMRLVFVIDLWYSKTHLVVSLEMFIPDHILFIGGHFGGRHEDEDERICYKRLKAGVVGYNQWVESQWCGMMQFVIKDSRMPTLDALAFSHYIDIKQIKYKAGAEKTDIDMFPVLIKPDHYLCCIDGLQLDEIHVNLPNQCPFTIDVSYYKELIKMDQDYGDYDHVQLESKIGNGWDLEYLFDGSGMLISLALQFFPINICEIDVKFSIQCVVTDSEGESTTVIDMEKIRRLAVDHDEGIGNIYTPELNHEQICKARSIRVKIDWEIVKMFKEGRLERMLTHL